MRDICYELLLIILQIFKLLCHEANRRAEIPVFITGCNPEREVKMSLAVFPGSLIQRLHRPYRNNIQIYKDSKQKYQEYKIADIDHIHIINTFLIHCLQRGMQADITANRIIIRKWLNNAQHRLKKHPGKAVSLIKSVLQKGFFIFIDINADSGSSCIRDDISLRIHNPDPGVQIGVQHSQLLRQAGGDIVRMNILHILLRNQHCLFIQHRFLSLNQTVLDHAHADRIQQNEHGDGSNQIAQCQLN